MSSSLKNVHVLFSYSNRYLFRNVHVLFFQLVEVPSLEVVKSDIPLRGISIFDVEFDLERAQERKLDIPLRGISIFDVELEFFQLLNNRNWQRICIKSLLKCLGS